MAEPTLVQVFGPNAVQTATTITITKADLTGLTATSSNTAESLLAAILFKAQTHFTQTNFDANIDQSIVVANGFSSFVSRGTNGASYRQDQLIVSFAKLDTASTLNPDDY